MFGINKTTILIAAGLTGTLFVGYYMYLVKKRRNNLKYGRTPRREEAGSETPDPNINPDLELVLLQSLHLSSYFLERNDLERGAECLANAVLASTHPESLKLALQSSLPPHVYELVRAKLQERYYAMTRQGTGA